MKKCDPRSIGWNVDEVRGVYVPPGIWSLVNLSIAERIVLAEIVFLDSAGECFASNDHFAELLGCSKSNARKIIYSLTAAGMVSSMSKNGHGRRVLCPKMDTGHVQDWTPPCPEVDTAHVQNRTTTCPKPNTVIDKEQDKAINKGLKPARPTLEMVQTWFADRGAPMEADKFFDFYESNGWVQGKNKPIKNWEAAGRNWMRNAKKFDNGKQQRGFDRLKFNQTTIASWANDKRDGGID